MNGSSYVKIPLRSNPSININDIDKLSFIWLILASLHPCNNDNPNKVSNYRHYFDELNIEGFDFGNGFRCSDVQKFAKVNSLCINIFELIFYQDKNKWKLNLLPIEIIRKDSDRIVVLFIYRNN